MSLAKRVFELHQIELAIHAGLHTIDDLERQLSHNDVFEKARSSLTEAEKNQVELEKQYKELDWEAEELRNNLKLLNEKLFSGRVKNPKELLGYEQEAEMFKAKLGKKDDVLIDLMERIEAGKHNLALLRKQFAEAEQWWQKEQSKLVEQMAIAKHELSENEKKLEDARNVIDKDALNIYEGTKRSKNQAVVKVEQGRCLGCRVMLSVSELQRVRGGTIVTCSNCGRILYLS
jgi:hypothetical protein